MTREEVNGLDERIKELKLQHQEAERINLKNKAGDLLVDINYLEELRELRNRQEPCNDCVSREEVKQVIRGLATECAFDRPSFDTKEGYKVIPTKYHKGYEQALIDIEEKVKALPPVQPKQDWIPTTERLPEENGKYFVMYRERKEKIIRVGIDYFMEIDGELGFWCFDVIKWMPIPEYKENKE